MGTRHLTRVVKDGVNKVTQYGQWDGYPEGQGKTVVSFLNKMNVNEFETQLEKVKFIKDVDGHYEKMYKKFNIKTNKGSMTQEESEKFFKVCPELSRDTGANILNVIYDNKEEELLVVDLSDFPYSSNGFSCEFIHEINLDTMKYLIIDCYEKMCIYEFSIENPPTLKEFLKEIGSEDE